MNQVLKFKNAETPDAIIRELTPRDVASIISIAKDVAGESGEDFDVSKLMDKMDTVFLAANKVVIFKDCSDFAVEDLGFSELDELWPLVKEVNSSFLEKTKLLNLDLAALWGNSA